MTPCTYCQHPLEDFERYTIHDRAFCGSCFDWWHDADMDRRNHPYQCLAHGHPTWSRTGNGEGCRVVAV